MRAQIIAIGETQHEFRQDCSLRWQVSSPIGEYPDEFRRWNQLRWHVSSPIGELRHDIRQLANFATKLANWRSYRWRNYQLAKRFYPSRDKDSIHRIDRSIHSHDDTILDKIDHSLTKKCCVMVDKNVFQSLDEYPTLTDMEWSYRLQWSTNLHIELFR